MKIDAAALIGILTQEKESYQALLGLSKRKQELIIDGDIDGLSDAVRQAEHLMVAVRGLEKKRTLLVDSLVSATARIPDEPPRLSAIIRDFAKEDADRALSLRDEILAIAGELDAVNTANGELLMRSKRYVEHMLSAIMRDDSPVYSNVTKSNPRSLTAKLFDGRA